MNNNRLAIIGSRDLGQQIAHHATLNGFDVIGYFDDFDTISEDSFPILGKIKDIDSFFSQDNFDFLFIGIGYKHMKVRAELFNQFYNSIPFANIIHKSAIIDPTVKIGEGVLIYPGVTIDSNVILDNNILINIASTIAHDTTIKSHCFLSPRVALAGFITINEQCIIGINSTIIDNIEVITQTQIGGGSVVIQNINEKGVYVGNPIRKIR
jgi:sugar O-acyltransferase (sialic acid O-acetyltransferase NeuD family)